VREEESSERKIEKNYRQSLFSSEKETVEKKKGVCDCEIFFHRCTHREPRDTNVMRREAQRQQEQQTNKQKIHRNKRKV
jgi:hypothetical protein